MHPPLSRLQTFSSILFHSMLIFLFCAWPVYAGIYRWVDADGKVHFGDRPPAAETKEEMTIPQTPASPGTSSDRATDRKRLLEQIQTERENRREEARKRADKKKERERRCVLAKDRLRIYTESSSLYDLTQDGERRVLSFEERERVTTNAEQAVKRWCK